MIRTNEKREHVFDVFYEFSNEILKFVKTKQNKEMATWITFVPWKLPVGYTNRGKETAFIIALIKEISDRSSLPRYWDLSLREGNQLLFLDHKV